MAVISWLKSAPTRLGLGRSETAGSNELLQHEWTSLRTLWIEAKKNNPALNAIEATEIDGLFGTHTLATTGEGWRAFNEAEQRVGANLSPAQLRVEFGNLLQIAAGRNLAPLASHRANAALFEDAAKIPEQRAAYLALLYDLQSSFINARFVRRLRSEVASRLFTYGVLVIVLAAVAPLLLVWYHLAPLPPADPKKIAAGGALVLN